MCKGEYTSIVKNTMFGCILEKDKDVKAELQSFKVKNRVEKYLREKIENFIENGDPSLPKTGDVKYRESSLMNSEAIVSQKVLRCVSVLFLGVALHNLYVQQNCTGPPVEKSFLQEYYPIPFLQAVYDKPIVGERDSNEENELLHHSRAISAITGKEVLPQELDKFPKLHKYTRKKLEVNGETVYCFCSLIHYLHISRLILRILARPTIKPAASDPKEFLKLRHIMKDSNFKDMQTELKDERFKLPVEKVTQSLRLTVTRLKTAYLWCARSTISHYQSMEIYSRPQGEQVLPLLYQEGEEFHEKMKEIIAIEEESDEKKKQFQTIILLEQAIASHYFGDHEKVKTLLEEARQHLNLKVYLSGALGKRTKFQETSKAQLVLKTERITKRENTAESKDVQDNKSALDKAEDVRKTIKLDDLDTKTPLLEKIKFDEHSENTLELSEMEQCLILALCIDIKNSYAIEVMTKEQMLAFIDTVVNQTQTKKSSWLIYSTALLIKSDLEFTKYKTKERALLQLQLLIDQQDTKLTYLQNRTQQIEDSAKAHERLQHFNKLTFPFLWNLKLNLISKYLSLGVCASALELSLQCGLYENAVECLISMEKKNRGIKLLEHLIAQPNPNPNLYCQMGILTNDPTWFDKAWIESKFRNTRSQRLNGMFYFNKGDLQKCISSYELALKLNPLYPDAWFKLGVCFLQTEKYEKAKNAFLQVIAQEPTDADSYGNLSVALVKLNQRQNALDVLTQAVKYNHQSWRLWENYLQLSLDLRDWAKVINALNKLIDFKTGLNGKVQVKGDVDLSALILLVDGIITMAETIEKEEEKITLDFLTRKVHVLYERIKKECKTNADIWKIFSIFFKFFDNDKLYFDCLLRKVRALKVRTFNWEREESSAEKVVKGVTEVKESFLKFDEKKRKEVCDVGEVDIMIESTAASLRQATEEKEAKYDATELLDKLHSLKSG